MDRNACIALTCALAAHAAAAVCWPADRTVPSALEPGPQDEPPRAAQEHEPLAVDFVWLEPNQSLSLAPTATAKTGVRKPEPQMRSEAKTQREKSAPGQEVKGPSLEPKAGKGTGATLRMRGLAPIGEVDARAGSGLQAAIAVAAEQIPAQGPRSDLLTASAGPPRESSPWRHSGQGTMRAIGEPYEATIARDGTIEFKDSPNVEFDSMLAGHFDVTDAVMKSLGEVLYPYRKLKLMDQSREMRAGMAMRSKEESLHTALATYPSRLRKLWRDPRYSLAERKQLLFALWDECAETGSQSVLATAHSIRASTISFIQKVLPANTAEAYSQSELAAFNGKRQSSELFAPYSNEESR